VEDTTMKALVYHGPHQFSLDEVPVPQIQAPDDVILRVTLATPCTSDIHIMEGHMPFVRGPIILGHEFCGEIVELGSAVEGFKVGDRVHCLPGAICNECDMCKSGFVSFCETGGCFGTINGLNGAMAEYVRIPHADQIMIPIPDGLVEEDVLLLGDMLGTAWFGITNAEVKKGDTVAVYGVGPVGMCACLLAKKVFEAETVFAVDLAQYRLDAVLNAGVADVVINPTEEDPVKKIRQITHKKGVNAVVETAGVQSTITAAARSLGIGGILSTISIFAKPLELPLDLMPNRNIQLKTGIQQCQGMDTMLELIKAGTINTRFLQTHRAPLNDIINALDVFGGNKDGCIKYLITPYER
jgi:alcohol dehydrogenase